MTDNWGSRTVDESKLWMTTFHKLNYRYIKVYKILPTAEIAQYTLPRGFFSGYSGFLHSWKTSIFKFQFNKIGDTLLWVDSDEKFFDYSRWTFAIPIYYSVHFLVTCARVVLQSPLQLTFQSMSKLGRSFIYFLSFSKISFLVIGKGKFPRQLVSQSVSQSVSRSIDRSINQSTNHVINQKNTQ